MKCVKCKKLEVTRGSKYYPFCSERCKLSDLGAWSAEDYRIPVTNQDSEAVQDSEVVVVVDESNDGGTKLMH